MDRTVLVTFERKMSTMGGWAVGVGFRLNCRLSTASALIVQKPELFPFRYPILGGVFSPRIEIRFRGGSRAGVIKMQVESPTGIRSHNSPVYAQRCSL